MFLNACRVVLALSACASALAYQPVIDSDRNRSNFYQFEKRIAAEESNKHVPALAAKTLRITHFDAHWHGMSVDEFVKITEATQSHVVVARGVPEREGYDSVVRSALLAKGFHSSTIVRGPSASLPSGIVIGLKGCELDTTKTEVIGLEDGTAGWQVAVSAYGNVSESPALYYLLIATLDPFDAARRARQTALLQRRIVQLDQRGLKFFVLGGFYATNTLSSIAAGTCSGMLQDAFGLLARRRPSYTSWTGTVTDTAFVSRHSYKDVRNVSVWHAGNVDCLPIVMDVRQQSAANANAAATPKKQQQQQPSSSSSSSWTSGYKNCERIFACVNWKIVAVVGAAIAAIVLFVLGLRLFLNRKHEDRKIQATATWTDSDLKIARKTGSSSAASEKYPDEKSRV